MHMHLHLADSLQDFGPLHAFWLYSFERYNGLLGKQPTNNRSIELQPIKRFLRDNAYLDLLNAAESVPLATQFRDIVGMQCNSTSVSGIDSSEFSLQLPAKYTLDVLDSHEVQLVREAYAYLHPAKSKTKQGGLQNNKKQAIVIQI